LRYRGWVIRRSCCPTGGYWQWGNEGGAQARSGVSATELFDARTGKWTAGPLLDPAWVGVTATLLGNGKVLLFGGEDAQGFPRPEAFLFG